LYDEQTRKAQDDGCVSVERDNDRDVGLGCELCGPLPVQDLERFIMKLKLVRKWFSATATIGELYLDDAFQCYTLEDVVRVPGASKVYGKTAIAAGIYNVVITMSNRFKRLLPLLLNVPEFEGVRIHPGNTSKDTDGCLLVGETKQLPDFIGNSRVAFANLFKQLEVAKTPITIEICNAPE
jgi:hypothetical protein